MILDTNQSDVKLATSKGQRVILPRLLDAVLRLLNRLSKCKDNVPVEALVLDFKEAFWRIHTMPEE